MMEKFAVAVVMCSATAASNVAEAGEWALRRSTTAASCAVQPTASNPKFGAILKEDDSLKIVCEEALARKAKDDEIAGKCMTYIPLAIKNCKTVGIVLPE